MLTSLLRAFVSSFSEQTFFKKCWNGVKSAAYIGQEFIKKKRPLISQSFLPFHPIMDTLAANFMKRKVRWTNS